MATGMHMDERSVDCLVLGHHDKDRKVSAKSVTMRAMTLCKNLSGYRELLLTNLPASMLLDLLKVPCLCMVCYGNVSSMRHIYRKSFDNTRQHIFLKTDVRKSRSQWSLNCICTDSVTPRCVHKPKFGLLGFMLVTRFFYI